MPHPATLACQYTTFSFLCLQWLLYRAECHARASWSRTILVFCLSMAFDGFLDWATSLWDPFRTPQTTPRPSPSSPNTPFATRTRSHTPPSSPFISQRSRSRSPIPEWLEPRRTRSYTPPRDWLSPTPPRTPSIIGSTPTLRDTPTPPRTPVPDPDDYLAAFRPKRTPRRPRYLPDTPTKSHRPPPREMQKRRKPKAFRCPNCKCRITITPSGNPSTVFQEYQGPPTPTVDDESDEQQAGLTSALRFGRAPKLNPFNYWRIKEFKSV